jgi:hypothetical protein
MKLRFTGDTASVLLTKQPSYFIVAVKPGEIFDVPEDVVASLMATFAKLERVEEQPKQKRRVNYQAKGV